MLEKQIFDLCSVTIKIIKELVKNGIISQEEFETNTNLKLQYIESYNNSIILKDMH